ncbi:MAG: hypothetical protein K2K97_01620 [Muribaculaceae bacterium]|nr:hypothetical protein [Muribaculaceae bacterium]
MRAKDIMAIGLNLHNDLPLRNVDSEMPLVNVLPRLLDSAEGRLGVTSDGELIGIVTRDSMLEGIGRMLAARDDCSVIALECAPGDYSASRIARAVEDTDAHLVDMCTAPVDGGKMQVLLRVRRNDPSPTVHSLERYGYDVVWSYGSENVDSDVAAWRLLELKTLLEV